MDQYTRRIIGFGIHAGVVDGSTLCRMFKQAIRGAGIPKHLSSDHDPLYRFHQWQANLSILGISEIKTVPYTPWSHPFIERLIGTIRRECGAQHSRRNAESIFRRSPLAAGSANRSSRYFFAAHKSACPQRGDELVSGLETSRSQLWRDD